MSGFRKHGSHAACPLTHPQNPGVPCAGLRGVAVFLLRQVHAVSCSENYCRSITEFPGLGVKAGRIPKACWFQVMREPTSAARLFSARVLAASTRNFLVRPQSSLCVSRLPKRCQLATLLSQRNPDSQGSHSTRTTMTALLRHCGRVGPSHALSASIAEFGHMWPNSRATASHASEPPAHRSQARRASRVLLCT